MQRRKTELEKKRELQQLVQRMNGYQAELVLAFIDNLFEPDRDAEEMKKAA